MSREALVYVHDRLAGRLREEPTGYAFVYEPNYDGPPVSLTLPVRDEAYRFDAFPPFFDGLLPEGMMLEALLRQRKLDRRDYLGQLLAVGEDVVGAVTVRPAASEAEGA